MGGRSDCGCGARDNRRDISDPSRAFALLALGIVGIYTEFCMPGRVVPGVLGGVLVLLALSGFSNLPINWLGAALLAFAALLLVMEVRFGAYGTLAIAGALVIALGAVMLVDSPVPGARIGWGTALGVSLPFAAITVSLLRIAVRARRNKAAGSACSRLDSVPVLTNLAGKRERNE